jgi:hypothetical protein
MTGPGIFSYSTTPANNVNSNTGINWDEGMSPAAVNNSARQNMTDTRNAFNDLIWFKYGKGDLDYSPVYVSGTSYKIVAADVSTNYHIGRRTKAVGSGTGTIYGTISNVAFSTDTTVTVVWDTGSLSNEALTIYLSQIPVTGQPLPQTAVKFGSVVQASPNEYSSMAGLSPTGTSSASGVMMGLGSSFALTPLATSGSGRVRIMITGWGTNSTSGANAQIGLRYGTGSAPANGAAVTGTAIFSTQDILLTAPIAGSPAVPYALIAEVTGLTAGTAYWFDIVLTASSGAAAIKVSSVIILEV